jgi:hypothetical protein
MPVPDANVFDQLGRFSTEAVDAADVLHLPVLPIAGSAEPSLFNRMEG